MSEYNWRPMRADDVDGVVAVAAAAFPDHFEARACFEERVTLFPQGCYALADGDAVKGYLIAYPWPNGAIPPLNSLLDAIPKERDTIYLHDLALHPDVRGQGHARPIVERLIADARALGAERVTLVSVNDSVPFWQSMGFDPVTGDVAIQRKLESYGEDASYMMRGI